MEMMSDTKTDTEDNKDRFPMKSCIILKNTRYDLPSHYEILKIMGEGAYGVVCKARDLKNNRFVAIKKVSGPFKNPIIAKRVCREVKLLKFLDSPFIIKLYDLLNPVSFDNFNDIYLVTDLMESDLMQIIYTKQKLTEKHIKYFMFQIICALKYIHSAGIIHRDIKPGNILVNDSCEIKLCDFGMARSCDIEALIPRKLMTPYVSTRFYRAPELILSLHNYTTALDIWSVGCVMAELYSGHPLFPGMNHQHMLQLFIQILGTPNNLKEFLNKYSETCANSLSKLPFSDGSYLSKILGPINPQAIDLIRKMLSFDPNHRINVDQILLHPYFNDYFKYLHEVEACKSIFNFQLEEENNDINAFKNSIYQDLRSFHPEVVDTKLVDHELSKILSTPNIPKIDLESPDLNLDI